MQCKHIGHRRRNVDGFATFDCGVFGQCTRFIPVDGVACCQGCESAETTDGVAIKTKRKTVASCVHRREAFRLAECESCNGNRTVKVYECDVHDECTIGMKLDGIKCCGLRGNKCDDFSSAHPDG